jgi:hypothetical protein
VPSAYMLLYHRRPTPVRAGGDASHPREERR